MTQLANRAPHAGAITQSQGPVMGRLQGEEQDDIVLPRIHIFQGLPKERELYGDRPDGAPWREGDLINTLSREPVPMGKFTPIFGYVEFIRFKEPRGSGLEYRTREKS